MSLITRADARAIPLADETLREDIVWSKPNGLPESIDNRCRRTHEWLLHFTKSPTYYADIDAIREPHAEVSIRRAAAHRAPAGRRPAVIYNTGTNGQTLRLDQSLHPLGRLPGSVWTIATQPLKVPVHLGVDHFAAFPVDLIRPVVLAWSTPGGVVLDPFGGTGTTALVAEVHGRRGVSLDLSADYCRLARWRTADPGQRARAKDVPKPDALTDGQQPLFGTATA